ncbi:hypothetical protein U1839_26500 [Sphingomonas sp. RT2P30]|uniref:hypothetical protein n=1 Tax=Parasphingomonas halimpatiens TaxID=3096162 RepID=UPI002FC72688
MLANVAAGLIVAGVVGLTAMAFRFPNRYPSIAVVVFCALIIAALLCAGAAIGGQIVGDKMYFLAAGKKDISSIVPNFLYRCGFVTFLISVAMGYLWLLLHVHRLFGDRQEGRDLGSDKGDPER